MDSENPQCESLWTLVTSGLILTSPAVVVDQKVTPPPPGGVSSTPTPSPQQAGSRHWLLVGAVPGVCGRQEESEVTSQALGQINANQREANKRQDQRDKRHLLQQPQWQ